MIEPVTMSVVVPLPTERAFALFTTELGSWWPLRTHSIGEERAVTCGCEPKVGGALFEALEDGTRHRWGRVLVWEPPSYVAFSWHPGGEESTAQQVEIQFKKEGKGTRVSLSHHGWEALGDKAAEARAGYTMGWKSVFGELFVAAAEKEAASRAPAAVSS